MRCGSVSRIFLRIGGVLGIQGKVVCWRVALSGLKGGRDLGLLDVVGILEGTGFGGRSLGCFGRWSGLRPVNLGEVCRSGVLKEVRSFVVRTLMKGGFVGE